MIENNQGKFNGTRPAIIDFYAVGVDHVKWLLPYWTSLQKSKIRDIYKIDTEVGRAFSSFWMKHSRYFALYEGVQQWYKGAKEA